MLWEVSSGNPYEGWRSEMARRAAASRRLVLTYLTAADAGKVIKVTVSRMKSRPKRIPTAAELVEVAGALLREIDLRCVATEMPSLKMFGLAFSKLHGSAAQLSNCVDELLASQPLSYFLLVSNIGNVEGFDPEGIVEKLGEVNNLLKLVSSFATRAKKEVAMAEKLGDRWIEISDETPRAWLYGQAIPEMFEQLFGDVYKISKNPTDTSPGRRFTVELLTRMKSQPPSPGELDRYLKERQRRNS